MTEHAKTRKMTAGLSRRRALAVIAAGASLPLWPTSDSLRPPPILEWRGSALGAQSQLRFVHAREPAVRRALTATLAEIARLERIFSLFLGDSELSRLNRDGRLIGASHDLRLVTAEALRLAELSGGAFDPSVQPLWQAYAEAARDGRLGPEGLDARQLDALLARVDYRALELEGARLAFAKPGMAASFNGIAQGYITDRIAALLRDLGFTSVLVQLGETYALAARSQPWRIRLSSTGAEGPETLVELSDRAVASSSGQATRFDASGHHHHLLHAREGRSAHRFESVSVVHDSAMLADGLSTALSLLPGEKGRALLAHYRPLRAFTLGHDGLHEEISL
jgi:thiamine biosynthesis lipoprotein